MSLKIKKITADSLADKIGLNSGDTILEINNNPIEDFLDLQFYSADETLKFKYRSDSKILFKTIIQDWSLPVGIEPELHKCRTCTNNCIFCFVDQMSRGSRLSLNMKDDDYKLSFVYGNFITLTNLTDRDYQKIFAQHLSPLYISVHTTDTVLHKKILRYQQDFNIREKLQILSDNGIDLHTQIVVIPGWNDGEHLVKTLEDLSDPGYHILSIGVVPVGLTKFRKSLTALSTVTPKNACDIIDLTSNYPNTYCSDEFFLLANRDLPPEEYYNDYPQLENGIGMLRLFLTNWEINKNKFLIELKKLKYHPVFICGDLVQKYLQKISIEIELYTNKICRTQVINNEYFGKTVTVTGLLTGADIIAQTELKDNEIAVLSNGIFNPDGITLDNISKQEMYEKFGKRLIIIDEEFADWDIRL